MSRECAGWRKGRLKGRRGSSGILLTKRDRESDSTQTAKSETMESNWGLRTAVCLGLTLLALCSTSLALDCYDCQAFSADKCEHKASCVAPKNTCLKVTSDGKSSYQCWESNRCDINSIKSDFQLTKFTSSCCQTNLCNHSAASLPMTYLVLALAASLLLMWSW